MAFSLKKYSEITEKLVVEIHPDMDPVEIDMKPDMITRGDMKMISDVAADANKRGEDTDRAMLKAIAGWNLTYEEGPVPVTLEVLDKLGAVLYAKIANAIWGSIQGKIQSESA